MHYLRTTGTCSSVPSMRRSAILPLLKHANTMLPACATANLTVPTHGTSLRGSDTMHHARRHECVPAPQNMPPRRHAPISDVATLKPFILRSAIFGLIFLAMLCQLAEEPT